MSRAVTKAVAAVKEAIEREVRAKSLKPADVVAFTRAVRDLADDIREQAEDAGDAGDADDAPGAA